MSNITEASFGKWGGGAYACAGLYEEMVMNEMTTDTLRFDPVTRALHWLVALLVVATYALALYREGIPKGDLRTLITMIHMSLGASVFALALVRIFWRFAHAAPRPVPMSPLLQKAAHAGHGLLYLAMLGVPLVGLVMYWAKGRTPVLFGVMPLPPMIGENKALAHTLEEAHEELGHLMMLAAFGHAAVAIWHHKVLKDGTLGRMWPSASPVPEKAA